MGRVFSAAMLEYLLKDGPETSTTVRSVRLESLIAQARGGSHKSFVKLSESEPCSMPMRPIRTRLGMSSTQTGPDSRSLGCDTAKAWESTGGGPYSMVCRTVLASEAGPLQAPEARDTGQRDRTVLMHRDFSSGMLREPTKEFAQPRARTTHFSDCKETQLKHPMGSAGAYTSISEASRASGVFDGVIVTRGPCTATIMGTQNRFPRAECCLALTAELVVVPQPSPGGHQRLKCLISLLFDMMRRQTAQVIALINESSTSELPYPYNATQCWTCTSGSCGRVPPPPRCFLPRNLDFIRRMLGLQTTNFWQTLFVGFEFSFYYSLRVRYRSPLRVIGNSRASVRLCEHPNLPGHQTTREISTLDQAFKDLEQPPPRKFTIALSCLSHHPLLYFFVPSTSPISRRSSISLSKISFLPNLDAELQPPQDPHLVHWWTPVCIHTYIGYNLMLPKDMRGILDLSSLAGCRYMKHIRVSDNSALWCGRNELALESLLPSLYLPHNISYTYQPSIASSSWISGLSIRSAVWSERERYAV
ncbi:uncharacterized protein MYCFIDRAFT_177256 [Pseudocercospora fijiensis CIRAD86]|uniref:Uncharacterized protein n=1 Tax=Pseudocercospora fijiensis (strain CIRAD86) TaxID=383855 RepID=M3AS50_PSEFD|nr:uncharacterized protein MYCFIDRAFT_177256 [Pseudocercospora fijiensis CIRAD86]EME80297.1 hypothetical protein MYCFIDRAFT_177256 [Pseudocercospora fijiensis CIRAD86]